MHSPFIYHKKANGKLLLTSEYFVLDGALALACPTKYGQTLSVAEQKNFSWTSIDKEGQTWLSLTQLYAKTEDKPTQTLKHIFSSIKNFKPKNKFEIRADFPAEWGLGSSSTLIALLADYFEVNPYELNQKIFRGSGYDIACAFAKTPLLYSNQDRLDPATEAVQIPEEIQPYCYFLYLGKKQNSREGIEHYSKLKIDKTAIGQDLTAITQEIIRLTNYKDWMYLLDKHEDIISKNLKLDRVKNTLLKNCPYFVKSLGAWGGDFVLLISDDEFDTIKNKLKKMEFDTIFAFDELIIS